jgi:hypothetical protein
VPNYILAYNIEHRVIPSIYIAVVLLIFITHVWHYYDDAYMVTECLVSSVVHSYVAFWCVQVCVLGRACSTNGGDEECI